MSKNDRIILDDYIAARKEEVEPDLSDADYFEIFSAEQILKKFDLSYEEVVDGIVGGGNDGGIDSLYLFVHDILIREEIDIPNLKKKGPLYNP